MAAFVKMLSYFSSLLHRWSTQSSIAHGYVDVTNVVEYQELAERGIPLVVATPRNTKRALTPFSTPAHKGETPKARGKVFGKRLGELTQRAVSVPNLEADLMVPKFVDSACTYIEDRKEVEGIYRMSGSQGRQRVIRAHIEEQQTDFASISPLPHVLDVASLLKQFLRELPEPVIPRSLHTLLSSCYLSTRPLENLQLALLLLPPSHSATLTFLLCHLKAIAEASGDNKMGAANLAIVLRLVSSLLLRRKFVETEIAPVNRINNSSISQY